MTKQTTEHDETVGHDNPPVIAGCNRQSHKSNRHSNLSASHPRPAQLSSRACPAVIPDLIGDLRAFGLAPGARRKDAKRMFREARKAGLP